MNENFEVPNEQMETLLKEYGRRIRATLPNGVGFTLFLYDYGEGGSMFYLSTSERTDMIKALEEFILKQKTIKPN
jgi:hypothetical protein